MCFLSPIFLQLDSTGQSKEALHTITTNDLQMYST